MTASALKTAPFSWPIRVYWEDTDAGGIVFYANYLKFFERARTEWLRARGVAQSHLKEHAGGMFVVSDAQLRYHHSARLDDELLVTARPVEVGRASMLIQQQALLTTNTGPRLLCEATFRIGWIDATSHRPARIPPPLLEALS